MNATKAQVATLRSYKKNFENMLNDEEAKEFFKSYSDFDILDKTDYIQSYRKLLQLLNGVGELDKRYFKVLIHNDKDALEDALLENEEAVYDRIASLKLAI